MLQNPTLRLVNCTPFKGEIIDSEVFLDAQNAFIDFLSGGQPTQVDVESPEDLDLFDNETTWVLAQNPDKTVELRIKGSAEAVVTYTP